MRTKERGAGGFGRKSDTLLLIPEDFLSLSDPHDYLKSWSFGGDVVLNLGLLSD